MEHADTTSLSRPSVLSSALSSGRANYYLLLLALTQVLCFFDKHVIYILMPAIKAQLRLSDASLGFISGLGFTLASSLVGLPVARYSDRVKRTHVIVAGLTLWSIFTSLGGVAANALQLVLARIGVGLSETTGTSPAHSVLYDIFEKRRRGVAFGLLSSGAILGAAFGLIVGGWGAEFMGWRGTLMLAGAPGIVLAIVIWFTMREPERGLSDARLTSSQQPSWGESFRFLAAQRSLRWVLVGTILYGIMTGINSVWTPSLMVRIFDFHTKQLGLLLGLSHAVFSTIAAIGGGWMVTHFGREDDRWRAIVPAGAFMAAAPVFLVFLFASTPIQAVVLNVIGGAMMVVAFGPSFSLYQAVTHSRLRAFIYALHVLIYGIGIGFGPYIVGLVSDAFPSASSGISLRNAMLLGPVSLFLAGLCYGRAVALVPADVRRAEST